jgi:hypothetical protein
VGYILPPLVGLVANFQTILLGEEI